MACAAVAGVTGLAAAAAIQKYNATRVAGGIATAYFSLNTLGLLGLLRFPPVFSVRQGSTRPEERAMEETR
ncbi:MAG: hypothetical protein V2I33_19965 [Kangiellaceae bacterium]|nr:hypothetical protein [Kangiellaceae bacterium]